MPKKLPISLCIFVKNEEESIRGCIESVLPVVSEVVVVDTGSTDRTVEIAKDYTDRVYEVGFTDFGSIRTLTAHLSNMPWILMLDADERLDPDWEKLEELITQGETVPPGYERAADGSVPVDSWALPRKRWADEWMVERDDVASYPDWQVRLFKNHTRRKKIRYVNKVHERVENCIRTEHSESGPVIHHFQNVNKNKDKLKLRQEQYEKFHKEDLCEGVVHSIPAVIEEDKS